MSSSLSDMKFPTQETPDTLAHPLYNMRNLYVSRRFNSKGPWVPSVISGITLNSDFGFSILSFLFLLSLPTVVNSPDVSDMTYQAKAENHAGESQKCEFH